MAFVLPKNSSHFSIRKFENGTYNVQCFNCTITNCLDPTLSPHIVIIVKQPPYVMLPVKLDEPWYDGPGLYAIELMKNALSRKRRFVAAFWVLLL